MPAFRPGWTRDAAAAGAATALRAARELRLSRGSGRNQRVWAVVSCIPHGRVATYAQVAALAGIEGRGAARQAGYALAALEPGSGIPWHRVVNARGQVSRRRQPGREGVQDDLLAAEGVAYDAAGAIDLARFEWDYAG